MRMTAVAVLLVFPLFPGVTAARASTASEAPARYSFYARGLAGYTGQALRDMNDFVAMLSEEFLIRNYTPSNETFRGVAEFGGEAGLRLRGRYGLGLALRHQGGTISNRHERPYTDPSGNPQVEFRTSEMTLALTTVSGVASVYTRPPWPRLSAGIELGLGFGSLDEKLIYQDTSRPLGPFEDAGSFKGRGLVAGAFLGFDHTLPRGLELFARSGYRLGNLGEFTGKYRGDVAEAPYPPVSFYKGLTPPPFPFDFSGGYVHAGLGWRSGR